MSLRGDPSLLREPGGAEAHPYPAIRSIPGRQEPVVPGRVGVEQQIPVLRQEGLVQPVILSGLSRKNESVPGLVPSSGPEDPFALGSRQEGSPGDTQASSTRMIKPQIHLQGLRSGLPPGAPGHVHFHHAPEHVGSIEDRGQPSYETDPLSGGEGNDGQVRAGVPTQGQRDAVHDHGDLPVLPSPEGRLRLPPGIAANLNEGHLPKNLLQGWGRPHHHGVQDHLDRAGPAGGGNGPGDHDHEPLELEDRHPGGVGPGGIRYLGGQRGGDEQKEECSGRDQSGG